MTEEASNAAVAASGHKTAVDVGPRHDADDVYTEQKTKIFRRNSKNLNIDKRCPRELGEHTGK